MLNIKTFIVSAAVLGISGCAAINEPDYSSPYTTPRVGTIIKLNQELSARNGVRIYLQDGLQLTWIELEKQHPYCQFYVLRKPDDLRKPLTIEPDTFTVESVFRRKDSVAVDGIQLAMNGGGESEVDRGSSQRTMSTYMELSSENQPNVTRLICSRWEDPQSRFHVSVEQIVQSLGDVAQFISPRSS